MCVYNKYMIIFIWNTVIRQSGVINIDVDVIIGYGLAPEAVVSQATTQDPGIRGDVADHGFWRKNRGHIPFYHDHSFVAIKHVMEHQYRVINRLIDY